MAFGVTQHQIKVFMALLDEGWLDPKEVEANTGVCLRTCHRHLENFVLTGVVEKKSIFPKHYYKLRTEGLSEDEKVQIDRLQESAEILGLT